VVKALGFVRPRWGAAVIAAALPALLVVLASTSTPAYSPMYFRYCKYQVQGVLAVGDCAQNLVWHKGDRYCSMVWSNPCTTDDCPDSASVYVCGDPQAWPMNYTRLYLEILSCCDKTCDSSH